MPISRGAVVHGSSEVAGRVAVAVLASVSAVLCVTSASLAREGRRVRVHRVVVRQQRVVSCVVVIVRCDEAEMETCEQIQGFLGKAAKAR